MRVSFLLLPSSLSAIISRESKKEKKDDRVLLTFRQLG
jgi:hypothetical protein